MKTLSSLVSSLLILSSQFANAGSQTPVCASHIKNSMCERVSQIINLTEYNASIVDIAGTRFYLFLRKQPVLQNVNWTQSIQKSWPRLKKKIAIPVTEAAVVDFDAPLTGGSLGPHILGIFSSSAIDSDFQEVLQQSTGWSPEKSSFDYILKHYGNFKNPQQAYLDDMIIHELAHLYFGFGETKVGKNRNDWWFALGLGLIYDRWVWSEFYFKPSPLFDDTAKRLRFYEKLPVDQRLVNPETASDEKYHLPRLQVYGHAKALEYLSALRKLIGEARFDHYVQNYLNTMSGRELAYDQFLQTLLPEDLAAIHELEERFVVR